MSELIPLESLDPVVIFTPAGSAELIKRIQETARGIVIDVSTKAGRENCASVAYKIAKTKTYIDGVRKDRVSEQKKALAAIDAQGRVIWDALEELQDEIRRPLTEFEQAEKARVAAHEKAIADLLDLANIGPDEPVNGIVPALQAAEAFSLDNRQEFLVRATEAKQKTIDALKAKLAARQKFEDDQAELARLRAEAEARAKADREAEIARKAAEAAKAEAERKAREVAAEAERQAKAAAAKAEAEARAKIEAAEKAKADAERKAREEAEAADRAAKAEAARLAAEAQAKIDAAEKAKRDAEAKAAAELARAAAEKAEAGRKAEHAAKEAAQAVERERQRVEAERVRAEQQAAKRAADQAHKGKINAAARDALVDVLFDGCTDRSKTTIAEEIIRAIALGKILHVTINY